MRTLAQELPLHIIKDIAFYVCNSEDDYPQFGSEQLPVRRRLLLQPMFVCKSWNEGVSSIFYHSVLFSFDELKTIPGPLNSTTVITLDNLIDFGKTRFLKILTLYMSPTDFYYTEQSTDPLKRILDRCGPINSVYNVNIAMVHHRGVDDDTSTSRADLQKFITAKDLLDSNMDDYAKKLALLLPNRCAFGVFDGCYDQSLKIGNLNVGQYVFDWLPHLFGSNFSQFTSGCSLTKPVYDHLSANSLTRVSLWSQDNPELLQELLRYNHATLEYVWLEYTNINCVANMIRPDDDGNAPVYYRLKHLQIISLDGVLENNEWHIFNNPFPALEVLICYGRFPFNSHTVLRNLRGYLRVLKIDVDKDMLECLDKHQVLDTGSFKSLKVVSLGRSSHADQLETKYANEMFIKALNLCSTAHTVHNRFYSVSFYPDNVFQRIEISHYLRVLDLGGTYMHAGQIIQLLSRAKRLYKAHLALINQFLGGGDKMISDDRIIEFQKKYGKYQSNVQLVEFVNFTADNFVHAAALIVMIADILPSIKKVIVAKRFDEEGQQIMQNIRHVLNEPIFKSNDDLQGVKFIY